MKTTKFRNIIPTAGVVVDLEPTALIRWFSENQKPPKLQQLWRDKETGSPYWRDVPTEYAPS